MTPEQAQQRRQDAIRELVLGLERLTSAELSPGYGGRLDAMLLDYAGRVQSIETAEFDAAQRRQYETQADADFKRWQAGAYQPGAQPVRRGEATPAQMTEQERIAATQEQLAARGLGRI
jgi:hypothetical protein